MASILIKNMRKVGIIGGGAAGMMAAIAAATAGADVTLLERNEKLGKKVYITGKGRCNVTNACAPDAFQKQVVKNPRFLFSALNALPPQRLMEMMETWGCPLMVERGDRVFPQSEKASDVTRALEREMKRLGVRIRLQTRVKELRTEQGRVVGLRTEAGEEFEADAVIVCTGGKSYPSTGSTGDGYRLLASCGHGITPAKAALVGLCSPADWVTALQGLSLKNVRLTVKRGKKVLFSDIGEMLFTHFGISGPLVLSASSHLSEVPPGEAELALDLKPGLTPERLDERVLRDVNEAGKKQLQTLLCGLYPARLAECMPALCGLDGRMQANELTREGRAALVNAAKELALPISGLRPLEEAIITRGGADVRQINPKTMESKLAEGLYAAGEVLDVDALTGGFNMHIAFCTGYAAGLAAGKDPGAEDLY